MSLAYTRLHVIWHQDLASFLDHWLWLELLFAEGVPPGVEVLLLRDVGHSHVRRIHVKDSDNIWPAARGRQQRWAGGRGRGRGWLTRVIHTCLTPWNYKKDHFDWHAFQLPTFILKLLLVSHWEKRNRSDSTDSVFHRDDHQMEAEYLPSVTNNKHIPLPLTDSKQLRMFFSQLLWTVKISVAEPERYRWNTPYNPS